MSSGPFYLRGYIRFRSAAEQQQQIPHSEFYRRALEQIAAGLGVSVNDLIEKTGIKPAGDLK